MANGENAEFAGRATKEYWGRRPSVGEGKANRQIAHRIERARLKRSLRRRVV